MYKLKIKVTKEILLQSKDDRCNGSKCAIARACSEILDEIKVGPSYINFYKNDNFYAKTDLPYEACEFVLRFDCSSKEQIPNLPEFEFEVELPESYINTINIDEVKEMLKDSKTLELV